MSNNTNNESFAQLFEESLAKQEMRQGEVITAEIVRVDGNFVVVNAGLKSESYIPVEEFKDDRGEVTVNPGDFVSVAIESVENGFGDTILSRDKAKRLAAWMNLEKALESGELVTGTITGKVKGGLTVMTNGIRAFLPGSLVDTRPVKDTTPYEGKTMEFKVIKLDRKRNNVVVSRRAVVEASMGEERAKLLETLKEGAVVKGVVKNITDYGAFVEIEDGIEGLVHISELANRHVENPETVVKPGEEDFVTEIAVDRDRRRISLSLKQANDSVDPASEDFDPALYGMPAEYDEQGNYKYPEGFDPNTNEWIAGYEKQREEWESQYATAHDLWEQHKEFVAKELENAEASAAEDGQAPKEEKVEEVSNYSSDNTSNGTLADSDLLAALRDQLLGK